MLKDTYTKVLESYKTLVITKLVQIVFDDEVINQISSSRPVLREASKIWIHINLTTRFEELGFWQTFVMYRYLKFKLSENTTTYLNKED